MFEFKKEMDGNDRQDGSGCECCGPIEEQKPDCGCGDGSANDKNEGCCSPRSC